MLRQLWYSLCVSCKPNGNKTIRLAFPLSIITALFLAAAVSTEEHSYITITTTPTTVQEGERLVISVSASTHTPVNAVDIVIDYPDTQIEVTGIETGESVITLWAEEPYAEDGAIHLRGGTFKKGFLGEHLIARINAKATESGVAKVTARNTQFIAGDGKGTEITVSDSEKDEIRIYIANADGSLVGVASVTIITDIDGDGKVDFKDVSAFMTAWFQKNSTMDFNGDGKMTFRDFSILLADSFLK